MPSGRRRAAASRARSITDWWPRCTPSKLPMAALAPRSRGRRKVIVPDDPHDRCVAPAARACASRRTRVGSVELAAGASTVASPISTFLPSTAQWHVQLDPALGVVDVHHLDLGIDQIARAHRGQELQRLAHVDRAMAGQAVRRSRPRSGRRSACRGRYGPRKSCPGHSRRPDAPGCGRWTPRRTSRYPRRSRPWQGWRVMPISMSSMQIVPRGMLSSMISSWPWARVTFMLPPPWVIWQLYYFAHAERQDDSVLS
jgi:hypothetical protein